MSDCLEPVAGYFSGESPEYYLRVRQTLLAGFAATVLASVVVLPSFSPEYALVIRREGWKRYYATYRAGNASIWQATRHSPAAPVTCRTLEAALPPALAQALVAVFEDALAQTRYADSRLVLDGTRYYFQAGLRSGKTHSPESFSRVGKLVALAEHLAQQLTASAGNAAADWAALSRAVDSLRVEFT